MGCGESKAKEPREDEPNNDNNNNNNSFPNSASNHGSADNNVPPPRVADGDGPYANSTELPVSHARADAAAVHTDEDGKPIQLPKGSWVKTEGTPYYYSAMENLYYHPASYQFYDPTNQMWFDPEKNEWYRDE